MALTTGDANVTNSIELLLGKEHADISYLKKDKISSVVSKALSETYRLQPNDPVQFFANYLLNHNKTLELVYQNQANESKIGTLKSTHQEQLEAVKVVEAKKIEDQKKQDQTVTSFYDNISKSTDLNEDLQGLVDFLQEQTGACGVYIGKLVYQKKPIEEDAADNAHFDDEAPKVIQYTHASKDHQFMVDRVITTEMGPCTHSVFGEAQEDEEVADDLGEDEAPKPKTNDILSTFKHMYVPEVVRDQRMWFKRVPKLGSFMAVPLIYSSCLSDEALEAAILDCEDVRIQKQDLQKEIDQFDEEQNQKEDAAKAAQEPFESETKEWPTIDFKPFISTDEKFVVCMDSMGQDRQFTDDQKRFVLNAVKSFRENWERAEKEALIVDRDNKIAQLTKEPAIEQEANQSILEQIERTVEELVANEAKEYEDDEQKEIEVGQLRLTSTAKVFQTGAWDENVKEIQGLHVIKMPRILQSLMFLMKVAREEICEPDSNKLFWKNAKKFMSGELQNQMVEYKVLGAKEEEFRAFQTINYTEKLIEGINQEDVDNYSTSFGKVFKWLATAISLRKQDIIRRKALTRKARENREQKQKADEERKVNRENYLSEAQEKFKEDNRDQIEAYEKWRDEERVKAEQEYGEELDDEEEDAENKEPPTMPEFNQQEMEEKFDDEFNEIIIPDEVVDEIDNDWVMEQEEWDTLITNYNNAKGDTM